MRLAILLAAVFALPALAGCIQTSADVEPAAVGPSSLVSLPRFEKLIKEHTPIVAADGTTLDAWVFRPDVEDTGETVPVIINFSPYWSNLAETAESTGDAFSRYLIDYFVPRGYAVALVSARGTGHSEGCFSIGGPTEVDDEDLVATFYGEAEWSNGAVTATGKSYDGTMAQGLITRGNPYVKTIVPVSPISELYKYNYFEGVPYLVTGQAFNTYYVAQTSLAQTGDESTMDKSATRMCPESASVQTNQFRSMLTGEYTAYWQARNYTALLPETLETSVFYIHGLGDWNVKTDHMVPWIEALLARDVPVKMWLGQWGHEYPTRADFNETLLQWLDHELKGMPNGAMEAPRVHVQDKDGIWRTEDQWPPMRAAPLVLHPSQDGTLSADPGSGSARYTDTPSTAVLTFKSEPLAEGIRLVGAPTLVASLSSTTPRATLSVTLRIDGRVIDQGFLDLAHRDGLATVAPLVPTMPVDVRVLFYPQDVVIPAGSVVTLELGHTSPGGAPVTVVPFPTGGFVTVTFGEGTFLTMPVIPVNDVLPEDPQPEDVGCWAC